MKNTSLLIELILLLSFSNVYGQVMSKELFIPSENGDSILMRAIKGGPNTLMYYRGPSSKKLHYNFGDTQFTNEFSLPILNNFWGGIDYTIKDMKIIGEKGVICGNISIPIGTYYVYGLGWTIEYENKGIVGWIDLDEAGDYHTPSIQCHLMPVDGTSDLWKLDITAETDTLVAIVGASNDTPQRPTLVTIKINGGTGLLSMFKINDHSETFTDVTFTPKMVATVSKFLDDHRSFGVRYENQYDLFYNSSVMHFKKINKYTNQADTNCGYRDSWRSEDADIQIVSEANNDNVIVGHDGWYFWQSPPGAVSKSMVLYRITLNINNSPTLLEAKLLGYPPDYMATLREMQYNTVSNTIMLLNRYTDGKTSFTNADIITGAAEHLDIQEKTAMSMDMFNDNRLCLGGIDLDSNHVFRYYQRIPNLITSCHLYASNNACKMSPRPELNTITSEVITSTNKEINWQYNLISNAVDRLYVQGCKRTIISGLEVESE